ncbi:MAG: protein translocase subunit SecD [Lysobacteraceae bacterium]|nr:MAG: protein translocase subunit SecD [Xanthomonadaceae bacterium]
MNRYPAWKYALLAIVIAVGGLYALPNLYGNDPAVQVAIDGGTADLAVLEQVERTLELENLRPKSIELTPEGVLARFDDGDSQAKAVDVLGRQLGDDYVVAPNLAHATPDWLRAINGEPMVLGLDLRGGVHFVMEVDMDAARRQQEDRYVEDIKSLLREEKIRYRNVRKGADGIIAQLGSEEHMDEARSLIARQLPELLLSTENEGSGFFLRAQISPQKLQEIADTALKQNITTLRNRVNEIGVSEPVVQQQGSNRIVVQLPGVQDTVAAKRLIGTVATLEYRAVDEVNNPMTAMTTNTVPPTSRLYEYQGQPILLSRSLIVSGEQLVDAMAGIDSRDGRPQVSVTLNGVGAKRMSDFTIDSVGKRMAVVFIEHKPVKVTKEDGTEEFETKIEERVISVARVNEPFGKRFQTTGLDSADEASQLALLLRAGALAAPVAIVEERTVGPSLGKQNIEQGFKSVAIGFSLVLVFMAIYYRVFGLVANLALACNVVLVVALLSLLGATLTLPGIAGIVLTVGMAVDANVLIFERIREELRNGNSPQAAIRAGYEKAFSTIADANVTTLIAAVVLLSFGTGPIKGFAVTLALGIVTSMFTAIMGTRAVINLAYGSRARLKKLAI